MKAYYEKNQAGMWCLVAYTSPPPTTSANGQTVTRSEASFDVPPEMIVDGVADLTEVAKHFEPPKWDNAYV